VTRTVEDLGGEIERRWTQLGGPPPDGEMKVVDLPQDVPAGQLLLGIADDGSRLLVPLESDAHRSFKVDRKSRGVHLLLRQLEQARGNRWYLDVVCLRPELRWLFSSCVADVLLRFERNPDVDPPAIVQSCYSAWRALFAGGGPRMTIKQLAGLYGELQVLERLLQHSATALDRWRGPLGEPHDFVSPTLDLEVKTTLSDEDDVVHIHGLEQLSAPAGGELRLAHLRVESPSADGDSLGDVIDRLRAVDRLGKLPGPLAAVGYEDEERHAYSELTFRLVSERWFTVGPSFPRLSAGSFPGGIVPEGLADFRYTLDLSRIPVPPIGAEAVEEALQTLCA
jgi:hypothetical protein